MKLVHITFHFEFADVIEGILDSHEIINYVRYPMMQGKDQDGKHYNSQVHPGSITIMQAQVEDDAVESLLEDIEKWRAGRKAHGHLQALVLGIERVL